MKIALLSNVTIEVFAGMLREEHAVWTPPGFGAWMETALDPPEDLISFSPDLVCVLLDARFGDFDVRVQSRDAARRALASAFPRATVLIPDLSAHFADLGEQAYDARMWTLARMPWSMSALLELKKLFSPPKKVLALDLDNTLWSGVVGEDGRDRRAHHQSQNKSKNLLHSDVLLKNIKLFGSRVRPALLADDMIIRSVSTVNDPEQILRIDPELNLPEGVKKRRTHQKRNSPYM